MSRYITTLYVWIFPNWMVKKFTWEMWLVCWLFDCLQQFHLTSITLFFLLDCLSLPSLARIKCLFFVYCNFTYVFLNLFHMLLIFLSCLSVGLPVSVRSNSSLSHLFHTFPFFFIFYDPTTCRHIYSRISLFLFLLRFFHLLHCCICCSFL